MPLDFLEGELASLEAKHLLRSLRQHDDQPGRTITIDGRTCINFSANNYLGLGKDSELIAGAKRALVGGTGSTASRLVTGNLQLHEQLEGGLAEFHGCEAGRLFNSGYQANIGVLSSLTGEGDVIVADRLNHASMIDGCRLSRAQVRVAEHAELTSFDELLSKAKNARRRFVVTDSVFSMDGDLAPLVGLRDLCNHHDASLIVDEAHGVGVLGRGRGACAELNVRPDVLVGAMGKAFGSFGAYVVGSRSLCDFLLNRARSFVFSTALPPAVLGACLAALDVLVGQRGIELQATLASNIDQMRLGLQARGLLEANCGHSAIFPLVVGDEVSALDWSKALLSAGFFCQPIRPPTVPIGTSRLRIALSALHTRDDLTSLLKTIDGIRDKP